MSAIGNPRWTAPEVVRKEAYSKSADVFSFGKSDEIVDLMNKGMVLYEVVAGKRPFDEIERDRDAADAIASGKTPYIPDNCSPGLRSIIQKCWNIVPKKRPSFGSLLRKFDRLL